MLLPREFVSGNGKLLQVRALVRQADAEHKTKCGLVGNGLKFGEFGPGGGVNQTGSRLTFSREKVQRYHAIVSHGSSRGDPSIACVPISAAHASTLILVNPSHVAIIMPVVLAFVTFMASAVAVDASPTKENAQTYEATVVKCLKHTHTWQALSLAGVAVLATPAAFVW